MSEVATRNGDSGLRVVGVPQHRDCRRPNCTGDATGSAGRGPYAGLCDFHVAEEREKNRERGRLGGLARSSHYREGEKHGLAASAVALGIAARKLEARVGARRIADAQAREALAEFKTAMAVVKQAAEALIAGDTT